MKKKFSAIFFLLIFLLSCAGCSAELPTEENTLPTESAIPSATPEPAAVISQHAVKIKTDDSIPITEQWSLLITAYENNCTPLSLDEEYCANLSFDANIADYKTIYISKADGTFKETESYIDTVTETKYDASSKKLRINCNFAKGEKCRLWSFLIRATDESGNEFYYYTRINSASISAPEPTPESTGVGVIAVSEHTMKSPVNDSLDVYEQWPYLIAAYKQDCTPLTLDEDEWFSIPIDLNIVDRRIVYICPLHWGGDETTNYIALFVDSEFDPDTKTLRIDGRSLTNDGMSLYSFLIWAVDESGEEFYYYTRVKT